MKRFFSFLVLMVGICSITWAQADPAVAGAKKMKADAKVVTQEVKGPKMVFEAEEVDYGTIEQGSDPYRTFSFTNNGTEPLVIMNAKGSCGCTVPTYPKEPILPGQTAEIKVRYDTKRLGPFTKRVTLTTNEGENTRVLTIKGLVEKKEVEPGLPENKSGGTFKSGGF